MILFFILAILQQTTIRAEAQPAQWYPELLAKFRLKSTEQSFCFESPSGVIQGDRIDAPVIPASVTKVYTTYVALKKFGPDFRFKTRFVLTPTPEGQTLHISGDQDGYFQVAQIFYVLNELNRDGVSKLAGIVFDDSFYLDFELDPDAVQKRLTRIFNTSTWDQAMKSDYRDAVRRARALGLKMEENIPLMSAGSVSPGNSSLPSEHSFRTWNIPSLPLIHLLKDMNVHSTNRFAKAVFLKIRDPEGFNRTLREDLGASSLEMNFQDGSGGRANYTTCRITLRLFHELERLLASHSLRLNDALSVAGMDGGTLGKRFLLEHHSGSVLGKTGTLPDIGVSTLAGMVSSRDGPIFYGLFNRSQPSRVTESRSLQNAVVDAILADHSGKSPFVHQPWSFEVMAGITSAPPLRR